MKMGTDKFLKHVANVIETEEFYEDRQGNLFGEDIQEGGKKGRAEVAEGRGGPVEYKAGTNPVLGEPRRRNAQGVKSKISWATPETPTGPRGGQEMIPYLRSATPKATPCRIFNL